MGLPELSNFGCLPSKAGGSPCCTRLADSSLAISSRWCPNASWRKSTPSITNTLHSSSPRFSVASGTKHSLNHLWNIFPLFQPVVVPYVCTPLMPLSLQGPRADLHFAEPPFSVLPSCNHHGGVYPPAALIAQSIVSLEVGCACGDPR